MLQGHSSHSDGSWSDASYLLAQVLSSTTFNDAELAPQRTSTNQWVSF